MDAGVASGFSHLAARENIPDYLVSLLFARRERKACRRKRLRRRRAVCGVAAPPRCIQQRLRRGALHPTPRRSQRRLTPFFSSLLGAGRLAPPDPVDSTAIGREQILRCAQDDSVWATDYRLPTTDFPQMPRAQPPDCT